MTKEEKYIQAQVDALLLHKSTYSPLDLLLQMSLLSQDDVILWKSGSLPFLAPCARADLSQIHQYLQLAGHYLVALGWTPNRLDYCCDAITLNINNQQNFPTQLQFSKEKGINAVFQRGYQKSSQQRQLDLFVDTSVTHQVNALHDALCKGDAIDARVRYGQLCAQAPDHSRLEDLAILVEGLENAEAAIANPSLYLAVTKRLVPIAYRVLQSQRQDYLRSLWEKLTTAIYDTPYNDLQPDLHLSYTAAQVGDWPLVRSSIERVGGWQTYFVLLQRHATACEKLQDLGSAILSWFMLCWQFSNTSNSLANSALPDLQSLWSEFQELDVELPLKDFPAWVLIHKPGLVKMLPNPQTLTIRAPASYLTLFKLQTASLSLNPSKSVSNTIVSLRAQLHQENTHLLHLLLAEKRPLSS